MSKLALATREQSAALAPSRAAGAKTITNYTRLIMKSSPSNELCVIGSLEFGLAQRGPVQLNYYVNQPDAFEAKTRARFQSGSGGGRPTLYTFVWRQRRALGAHGAIVGHLI